jgi:hypothetical protein
MLVRCGRCVVGSGRTDSASGRLPVVRKPRGMPGRCVDLLLRDMPGRCACGKLRDMPGRCASDRLIVVTERRAASATGSVTKHSRNLVRRGTTTSGGRGGGGTSGRGTSGGSAECRLRDVLRDLLRFDLLLRAKLRVGSGSGSRTGRGSGTGSASGSGPVLQMPLVVGSSSGVVVVITRP